MTARWLALGFLAGALAVPVFHQPAIALLYQAGIVPQPPYSVAPTAPFGVPQMASLMF